MSIYLASPVKYKIILLVIKILIVVTFIIFSISNLEAAKKKDEKKKDCIYCEKYENLSDWPEDERPSAFIYEKINYPKGMFHESLIKSKQKQGEAGSKVYKRFVKGKSSLNKYQHHMIRDMAYFEALFNEMLNDKKAKVETLEGLKKGREAMRMSLNISPKAKSSEAILKFWATGKMLHAAYKKNKKKKKKKEKKLTPEIAERAAVLASLKKQIATAKVNAQRAATIKAQEEIEATKQ
jgi:hypothetical protein